MDEKKTESQSDSSSRRDRDRVDRPSFHKDRPAPYSRGPRSVGPRPSTTPRLPPYNRVFIQNIPYEERWQGLKDLFRDKGKLQNWMIGKILVFILLSQIMVFATALQEKKIGIPCNVAFSLVEVSDCIILLWNCFYFITLK